MDVDATADKNISTVNKNADVVLVLNHTTESRPMKLSVDPDECICNIYAFLTLLGLVFLAIWIILVATGTISDATPSSNTTL